MKVFICKFFSDEGIEDKIGRLVSREKKRASSNLRVFCVDEPTQKKLESAGISSEAFYEYDCIDAEDESTWAKAYELSDELHASAEDGDKLKYSGINFLTLEYNIIKYVYAVKLANLYRRLAEHGQFPEALFITCSDARVDPVTITHGQPGDLFIVRNIGNFIPPYSENLLDGTGVAAAVEYAVEHLEVRDIIVCGHSDCGAMKALYHRGLYLRRRGLK